MAGRPTAEFHESSEKWVRTYIGTGVPIMVGSWGEAPDLSQAKHWVF